MNVVGEFFFLGGRVFFLVFIIVNRTKAGCVSVRSTNFSWPDSKVLERHAQTVRLGALAADTEGELDVLGHDGHALGVDRAEVGVLEQRGEVRLARLLHVTACDWKRRSLPPGPLRSWEISRTRRWKAACGWGAPSTSGTCGSRAKRQCPAWSGGSSSYHRMRGRTCVRSVRPVARQTACRRTAALAASFLEGASRAGAFEKNWEREKERKN